MWTPAFLFGVVSEGWREAFYLTYYLVSFLFSLDEPLNSNTNASSEDHRSTIRPTDLGCRGSTPLPLPTTGRPGQSACSLTIVATEGYLLSRWHIFLIHSGLKAWLEFWQRAVLTMSVKSRKLAVKNHEEKLMREKKEMMLLSPSACLQYLIYILPFKDHFCFQIQPHSASSSQTHKMAQSSKQEKSIHRYHFISRIQW